jgi:2-polyprenyl-3-methyl-5-hydroxy-6-metoxy-1,4-benzoquinol methylase
MTDFNLMSTVFSNIYKNNEWNMGQNESKSGLGSTLQYTENIRKELVKLIHDKDIKSIIDVSCGDWNWMKLIQNELCDYTGIDIVESVIKNNSMLYSNEKTRFYCKDFLTILKGIPTNSVDLLLCRHTCEHLPTEYNLEFINECKRVTKYLLLTTKQISLTEPKNSNLTLGAISYRPINLDLSPYHEVLNNYFVEKIYDGPSSHYDHEMGIHLYKFN